MTAVTAGMGRPDGPLNGLGNTNWRRSVAWLFYCKPHIGNVWSSGERQQKKRKLSAESQA